MKDADLLQYCRYYKGERRNPYKGKDQNKMMLWSYEQIWADMASGNTPDSLLAEYCLYLHRDLPELVNNDYAPMSLTALLYDRYMHFGGGAEGFKKLFEEYYMK